MSRVIVDNDLLSWEAFASGGKYGLPSEPKIVFQCLSEPSLRARYVRYGSDNAEAEQAIAVLPDAQLRELLAGAEELD